MKIGLGCPYDLNRAGGVQEHVLEQAAGLRRLGHTVKILTPRPRKNRDAPDKDTVFIGSSAKLKTPISTTLEVGGALDRTVVSDILAAEEFDILHLHEPEVPVLGAQLITVAECPIVATFHALYPETAMAKSLERLRTQFSRSLYGKITVMTAVSEAAASFVSQHTNHEIAIVPNGINLTKYKKSRAKHEADERKTILYIGRLEKRKGVRYLLKAYRMLSAERNDLSLVIAGDGNLRSGLEKYVRDHRLRHVSFRGFVDETEKLELLRHADLFCSPALYGESFGIVLLEAMASGMVTVCGDNPGYASVMTGSGRLSLVNPRNTDEMASRINLLIDDQPLRQAWLEWAKQQVGQYDYSRIVGQYEVIYKKALKDKT